MTLLPPWGSFHQRSLKSKDCSQNGIHAFLSASVPFLYATCYQFQSEGIEVKGQHVISSTAGSSGPPPQDEHSAFQDVALYRLGHFYLYTTCLMSSLNTPPGVCLSSTLLCLSLPLQGTVSAGYSLPG